MMPIQLQQMVNESTKSNLISILQREQLFKINGGMKKSATLKSILTTT